MWQFRFPIALLSYIKAAPNDIKVHQNTLEKARDWAKPLSKTRYKRPTLSEAEDYISQIIEDDKRLAERNVVA